MKLLSRSEELLLSSILKLKDEAYCNPIRDILKEVTGKTWAFGAIFTSLDRLEKKGLIESYLGEATPERGGRKKRYYRITPDGYKELEEIRKIDKAMWESLPEYSYPK